MGLSDLQLGLLGGTMFAAVNVVASFPIARLAERVNRVALLSICVTAWSGLTALCALPQTFVQLLIARMGVGAGEAGGTSPTHSLIADYFPPNRRATALAILVLGVPAGALIGSTLGGWITQSFGWRLTFVIIGLSGIVLAPLPFFTLKEPARGRYDAMPAGEAPPFMAVLRRLLSKRSWLHMLAASAICTFAGFAVSQFLHPLLVRRFDLGIAQAATLFGLVNAGASLVGYLGVGALSDRLAEKDKRAYAWVVGSGVLLSAPMLALGLLQTNVVVALCLLFVPSMFLGAYFGPMYGLTLNLVGPRMRASAIALTVGAINLVGYGLGPLFTGFASDFFAQKAFGARNFAAACPGGKALLASDGQACAAAGAQGLQWALLLLAGFLLWSAAHYALAGRSIRQDLADS
jgi:predicted MFS family arabinose efflux permease